MDTNIFRYAVAVDENGSISAAARKLFISQPALTKHIGKLEIQLGVKLFDRNQSPLVPTHAGVLFLEYANKYLQQEQEFYKRLREIEGFSKKHLLIATTHRGGGYVGNHTAAFLSLYPDISLEYLDLSAKDCETALKDEQVELAVYTDPVMDSQIEYMPLMEDTLIFVVPKSSPLLNGMKVLENSLTHPIKLEPTLFQNPNIIYVLSTPNHSLYLAECAFFKKYKISPLHFFRMDYVDTRYSIACGGGGVVLVPISTAQKIPSKNEGVFCTLTDGNLYRYIIIAKKKGHILSKEAEIFWKFMVRQKFSI